MSSTPSITDGDSAPNNRTSVPSSFTTINPPTSWQSPTPVLSDPNVSQSSISGRQRNPAVAQYLGRLCSNADMPTIDQSPGPPSAQIIKPTRERVRKGSGDNAPIGTGVRISKKSHGQGLANNGLRATNPISKQLSTPKDIQLPISDRLTHFDELRTVGPGAIYQHHALTPNSSDSSWIHSDELFITPSTEPPLKKPRLCLDTEHVLHIPQSAQQTSKVSTPWISRKYEAIPVAHDGGKVFSSSYPENNSPPSTSTVEFENAAEHLYRAQIDHDINHDILTDYQSLPGLNPEPKKEANALCSDDEDTFSDGIEDVDFLMLTSEPEHSHDVDSDHNNPHSSLHSSPQMGHSSKKACTSDAAQATASLDPVRAVNHGLSRLFTSPVMKHTLHPSQKLDMRPIVRPPFPEQVRDRSPVIGLTPNGLLRTCFRVGEAINAGRRATKNENNVVLELYARVLSSERNNLKQHFIFSDLFHSKPPYLKGEYDATIWKSARLHEFDSRLFLEQKNRLCRCIGKMRKNSTEEWILVVLNIWVAKKDDIAWVEGIINP